jgi:1-acyl-sn-glycerol-3-phosphate acyltransferase
MIVAFRSILCDIVIAISTIFLAIICIPLGYNKHCLRFIQYLWAKIVINSGKYICGIDYKIIGIENIKTENPKIICCRHQSMWETAFLLTMFKKPSFIIKKELLKIPFYGWHLKKMGMIPVKRRGGKVAMQEMIEAIIERINQDYTVIIFPEGTRNKPDVKPKYNFSFLGIFKEMKAKNIEIIPTILNSGIFWPKNSFFNKKSGLVELEFRQSIMYKNQEIKQLSKEIEAEML